MISLVRIDDRLVHAQIVVGWIDFLRCRHILIVDDAVAADPERADILRMVVPEDVKLESVGLSGVAAKWAEIESLADPVLVLFADPSTLRAAVDMGVKFREVNLGGMHAGPGRRSWMHGLYASDAEIALIREMIDAGIDFEVRLVPSARRKEIEPERAS